MCSCGSEKEAQEEEEEQGEQEEEEQEKSRRGSSTVSRSNPRSYGDDRPSLSSRLCSSASIIVGYLQPASTPSVP